jgi:hypothetical protein
MNDKIGIRIGIATAVIAIAMLAMVPAAAAYAVPTVGTIQFENGTTCPYGWTVCEENLNESYPDCLEAAGEPWCEPTSVCPPFWNYLVTGGACAGPDVVYFKLDVTSPDGKWYGEKIIRLEDAWEADHPGTGFYEVNLVVHEEEPPCEPAIEVNKTVWDGTAWVELIPDAEICETYRFRCEVHNNGTCCNLTNIAVTDTLSDSLEYANNATVDGVPREPDWIAGNQFGWDFTGPLAPCQTIVIEFDAHVIDYGEDCNVQNATAWCDETGEWVSDEDDACINVPSVLKPDLIVDSVYLNPDCKHYYFANEPNVVDITVKNIGTGAAGPSNASVSGASGTSVAAVGALDPGQSQTVTITDTVARPAGEVVTATADCYGEVTESNETNNASQIVDGDGDNVINHGLKGKWLAEGYAGPDPGNMTTWKSYELHGDLNYSVGDSYYLSGYTPWEHYTANWTAGDLPIPDSATDVVEARLYVYYTWDKAWVMPDNVSTSFNGVNQDPYDVHYTDRRGYGSMASYNLPYGALVYNVTDDFDTTGNHANVTKLCTLTNQVSMRGMMLVVVYEDPNKPLRQIFVIEEYDNLYGKASYCTTPEEATARALFTGPSIDMGTMVNANLITVAPGASPNEGDLIFNDQTWTNVWNFAGTNGAEIGIDERNVTAYLESTENAVGFQSSGDWMEASNAFLVVEYETKPDLVVSAIEPNCGGYLFGNESNEICAKIENIGGEDAGAFNVSLVADGFSEEVRISGLAAGANTTVCVTDPRSRNAGDSVSITVTADCNAEVVESDETNNASTLATTVVNNGYKGKRYTGGEDITTWKTFELKGNLLYSLGDSYYLSAYYNPDWTTYNASWTASDLPVPCTATVEEARLFVPYTWDKKGVMQTYVSLSFNGIAQTLDAHYSDEKMHATSYPYGMLAYDVTNNFNTAGNVANLTNSYPGGDNVSMRGMLLVVIYADDSEPLRKIIMNEEFDLLYGGSSKCTTPEEATAYAPFGAIDMARVANATLITVAPGAGNAGPEGDLSFNGQIWTDAWTFVGTGSPTPQIGINETNVTAYMNATGNEADFRSDGDYMEASNAFLVVEYKEEPIVSYGDSVYFKRNVRLAWRALGEPNNRGAVMFRNAKIAIELEETISDCEKVSVWVRRVAARPPTFEVGVSSDGSTWTSIGTETCTSFAWTRYDFTGDWDNVKYIGIRKPGGFWIPRLMGLDAVSAEGWN